MNIIGKYRRFHILTRNPFPTSATLMSSKSLFAKEMSNIRKRQDYAYWLRILNNNKDLKVVKISKQLGSYRTRKESLSSNKLQNISYNYLAFRISGYSIFMSYILVAINIFVWFLRKIL